MKKKIIFIFTALAVLFTVIFSSCATKEAEPEPVQEPSVVEEPLPAEEEPIEEPEEIITEEEDVVIVIEDDDGTDDEYLRSIANLDETETVSKQEFTDDKNEILQIIDELANIIASKNTLEWLKYIDEDSKEYYKNPVNLRKVQRKLPDPRIELKTIDDYFKNVWIRSRENSHIDEIRYESKTLVKAVQVREGQSPVVYYQFKKENGKWKVYIPPVS